MNANDPAFPVIETIREAGEPLHIGDTETIPGLTKRELLAAMVSDGDIDEAFEVLENWENRVRYIGRDPGKYNDPLDVVLHSRAKLRLAMADALIAELSKP